MKTFALAIALFGPLAAFAQFPPPPNDGSVTVERLHPDDAAAILRMLVPEKKNSRTVRLLVNETRVDTVDLGTSCSSSVSSQTKGTVDDSGDISARTEGDVSTDCRKKHRYYYRVRFVSEVPGVKKTELMLDTTCSVEWVWNECGLPVKDEIYVVVLKPGKHGAFDVDVLTSSKLGGKQTQSKYAVNTVWRVSWFHENNIGVPAHEESKPEPDFYARFRNDETFMRADDAKKAALLAAYFEIHDSDYAKASEERKKEYVEYVIQQLKENPR